MKNLTVAFIFLLTNYFAMAQAVDSVVSKKIIKDKKIIYKDLVYYNGHITRELYKDSLGNSIQSIDYYNSGKKNIESFITDSYRISTEYYRSGKRKSVDSSTTSGYWVKSYFRNARQKKNNFQSNGMETINIDSNASVTREYDWRWRLIEETFYAKGILDHRKFYDYYENGHPKNEYFVIQHGRTIEQDSISKTYYDNGQLRTEEIFKKGELANIIQLYDKDGISKSIGNFKDGTGIINIYSADGKLIAEECYHNGKLTGRKKL